MPTSTGLEIHGRRYPNLVMVLDSEHGAEFRVQLEVAVDDIDEAARLVKQLRSNKKGELRSAKTTIEGYVKQLEKDPARNPTAKFKQILKDAFDENIARAED